MRCVIARFPFDLIKGEVEHSMADVQPEPVTGQSVVIGSRTYPVKQVGEVITRQDRRDFTEFEVARALTRLGFVCQPAAPAPARAALSDWSAEPA
ncbi:MULTISPECIES: SCO5918 family protein [unclassified Streptomyces]|uniref:SCO5918 family protein n=1 Tax=unclassified Streptomyces TaxID=2593676 RepID=UPI002254B6E6|nr:MULTISPECIES: SCO5918 family protein [unclassified Streptomyces]MCX4972871.1 SCO5918 family protein [Streptomyces sp. NBC_00620]WTB39759.1 SCO5918 family protein [Streptomyces sp. NBC_00827]WUC12675.1 SCO5918 family protein [Streptomyces sp. NBC_00564]WUC50815.1 SCO5918 family protein [Streptomyces sp. NBC_00554]